MSGRELASGDGLNHADPIHASSPATGRRKTLACLRYNFPEPSHFQTRDQRDLSKSLSQSIPTDYHKRGVYGVDSTMASFTLRIKGHISTNARAEQRLGEHPERGSLVPVEFHQP